MVNIEEVIRQERELAKSSTDIRKSFKANLTLNQAKHLWMAIGKRIVGPRYQVMPNQVEVVTEIIKWMIMDETCTYNLQKGFFITGDIGVGKTKIMEIMMGFMYHFKKIIAMKSALNIVSMFKSREPLNRLFTSPLFIDDVGTENVNINVWGTDEMPIYTILNERYLNRRFLVFITTNLDPESFGKRYGDRVMDRIKEMCNYISIEGKSLRK